MRNLLILWALSALACGRSGLNPEGGGGPSDDRSGLEAISGRVFIVQVAQGVDIDETLDRASAAHGAQVVNRYRHALRGGALLVPNDRVLEVLRKDSRFISVEEDQPVFAIGKPPSKPGTGTDAGTQPQTAPTGYRLIGADATPNEGAAARVAVIDTGADLTHPDLVSNWDLALGVDCVNEQGGALADGNGHGTHVSGTIAATDNGFGSVGVGSQIKVVPVKVLNKRGSGSWSTVICGVDHVTAHAADIPVANMSLGGTGTECTGTGCTKSALQIAVENSVAAGVTYLVAAGNDGVDAANSVPAAYDAVITVSAFSDSDGTLGAGDGWPSFTNYGPDVDIAAPGVNIFSTWRGSTYATKSGTSMATPHVAAAAALFVSTHPRSSPAAVKSALLALAKRTYPGSLDPKHKEPLLDVRGLVLCTLTCSSLGFDCGEVADGCGGSMICGTCAAPTICGGSGTANVCGCTPTVSCATVQASCGQVTDDCGSVLECGSCEAPLVCGGGGTANACGCTPTVTCDSVQATCGTITDDCGNVLECGTCPDPLICGAQVPNTCG